MAEKNYLLNSESFSNLISASGVVNSAVFENFINNPENKDYVSGEGDNRKIRLNKLIQEGKICGGLLNSGSICNVRNQILSESAETIFDLETDPILFSCQFSNLLSMYSIDNLNEFIESEKIRFDNNENHIKAAMSSIVFMDKSIKDAREIAEYQNGKFKFLLCGKNIGADIRSYADGSVDHISLLFNNATVLCDLIYSQDHYGILRPNAFSGVVLNDETLEKLGIHKAKHSKTYLFLSYILYLFTKIGLFCSTYEELRSIIRKNEKNNNKRDKQIVELEKLMTFNKNMESKESVAKKIGEMKNKNNENEFDKSINLIGMEEEK